MTELFRGSLDRPTLAGLGRLLDRLAEAMARAGVATRSAQSISIAADELASNVLNHREGRDKPHLDLVLRRREDGALELELIDDGPEFDPFAVAAPDVTLGLEERPIGGLGIHLARRLASGASYRRGDDRNRVELRFDPPAAG